MGTTVEVKKPGTVQVKKGGGGAHKLDDLSDVDTRHFPPADGDALVFDDADGQWKPGDVRAGLAHALVPTAVNPAGAANYFAAPGDLVVTDATAVTHTVVLPTGVADGSLIGVVLIAAAGGHETWVTTHGGGDGLGGYASIEVADGPFFDELFTPWESRVYQYEASTSVWYVLDGAASAAVRTETARATGAETANANAIAAEVVRATAAEGGKATAAGLAAETARATAAEVANANAVAAETGRATAAELLKASSEDPRLLDTTLQVPMHLLRRYLSRRATNEIPITFVGDSITEGYYAGSDAGSWVSYLRLMLQNHLNIATSTGEGFIPAWHTAAGLAQRWAFTGAPDTAPAGLYGLGRRAVILHAGETATLSVACTRVWVNYSKDAGLGTLRVNIDGLGNIDVATAGAKASGFRLDATSGGTLAAGTHNIVVTAVGGSVVLDGAVITNGAVAGPTVYNGGHAGISAWQLAQDLTWATSLSQYVPGAIGVLLGVNDYQFGRTVAQFEADLTTVVNAIKAASPFSAYFVAVMWPLQGTSDATWQPWADATRRVARATGAGVVDLWHAVGTPDGSASMWQDTVHPNLFGSVTIAEAVFRQLMGSEPRGTTDLDARYAPIGTGAAVTGEDPRLADDLALPAHSWRRAIGMTLGAPIDVAVIGDSIAESVGAANDHAGWNYFLRLYLAQRYNTLLQGNGAEGWVAAVHPPTAWANRWVLSAGVDQTDYGYGWGRRACTIPVGESAALTVNPCTRIQVGYTKKVGGGMMGVSIDGGAVVNVDTSLGAGIATSGWLYTPATLAAGNHTVTVTATVAPIVLDGGFVTNGDEALGVRLWSGGRSGYKASDYADPAKATWVTALARMNADAVLIMLGINDYLGVIGGVRTPAQVQADLQTIILEVLVNAAVPSPSVFVMVPWPPAGTADATWAPYAAAIRAAARFYAVGVIDAWQGMGTPDGGPLWLDDKHPGAYGHIALGQLVNRHLTGAEPLPQASGFRGVWSATTNYNANDVVTYIGYTWMATAANFNANPAALVSWAITGAAQFPLLAANNLADVANAATARASLGLGTLATKSAVASADITDGTITDVDVNAAAGILSSKIATKYLFYGESVADVDSGAGTEATIAGLSSGAIACTAKGVEVSYGGPVYELTAGATAYFRLYVDGALYDVAPYTGPLAGYIGTAAKTIKVPTTAATHTFEVRIFGNGTSHGHSYGAANQRVVLGVKDA